VPLLPIPLCPKVTFQFFTAPTENSQPLAVFPLPLPLVRQFHSSLSLSPLLHLLGIWSVASIADCMSRISKRRTIGYAVVDIMSSTTKATRRNTPPLAMTVARRATMAWMRIMNK